MIEKVVNIVQGAGIGVGLSILGYLKEKPLEGTVFDGTKFCQDIISGAVAGGLLGFSGINVDLTNYTTSIATITAYGGLTVIIERIAKTVWRYLSKKE